MSNAVGLRYAKALFEISKESKSLKVVETSFHDLSELLEQSDELKEFIHSPLHSRSEQLAAISAVAQKAKFDKNVTNTLAVMAQKRRLAAIPAMIEAFRALLAEERDEASAEVISAVELSSAQSKALATMLKKKVGKDVALTTRVDESLLGGLIVKMGSTMIDSSVKGKLAKLHNVMKEVG